MRTIRAFDNYITAIATSIAGTLITVLATPFILRWIGAERFGLYRITIDWLGYLTLIDIGLGDALIPILSTFVGKHDSTNIRAALITGIRAFCLSQPIKLIIGMGMIFLIVNYIPHKIEYNSDLKIACLIGVFSSFFSPLYPVRTLIEVKQMGYRINQYLVARTVLTTCCALLFAWLKFGIAGQFFALFLGEVLFSTCLCIYSFLNLPGIWHQILHTPANREIWHSLWKLNKTVFLSNICGRLCYLSDSIIISFVLSPSYVTSFFMTQRLISFACLHLYGIGTSTWAALIDLHTKGEHDLFQKRFLELNQLITVISMITLGPIAAYNHHFIRLWLGNTFYAGETLTWVASINALFLPLIAFWGWIFSASGKLSVILPQYILYTGVNLVMSVLFTYWIGTPGPAVGTLIAIFLVTFWATPWFLKNHFGISTIKLYSGIFKPIAILLPFILITWKISKMQQSLGWVELMTELVFSMLLLTTLSWILIITPHERSLWKHRLELRLGIKL